MPSNNGAGKKQACNLLLLLTAFCMLGSLDARQLDSAEPQQDTVAAVLPQQSTCKASNYDTLLVLLDAGISDCGGPSRDIRLDCNNNFLRGTSRPLLLARSAEGVTSWSLTANCNKPQQVQVNLTASSTLPALRVDGGIGGSNTLILSKLAFTFVGDVPACSTPPCGALVEISNFTNVILDDVHVNAVWGNKVEPMVLPYTGISISGADKISIKNSVVNAAAGGIVVTDGGALEVHKTRSRDNAGVGLSYTCSTRPPVNSVSLTGSPSGYNRNQGAGLLVVCPPSSLAADGVAAVVSVADQVNFVNNTGSGCDLSGTVQAKIGKAAIVSNGGGSGATGPVRCGGGVAAALHAGSSLELNDCVIRQNTARVGGGLCVEVVPGESASKAAATLTLAKTKIADNKALLYGGMMATFADASKTQLAVNFARSTLPAARNEALVGAPGWCDGPTLPPNPADLKDYKAILLG